ncbi:MAG TPA: hypothetical protein D7I11_02110 [Candidatus Poseidoniales archaeon]|nr:MAG TPA: hypothetical protein D7I11_02110 [Candidatus Poseidoniales archaeon]
MSDAEEEAPEAAAEEVAEETPEEADAEEASAPKMKFREDMLVRVMEAAGIDAAHRDEFVVFAADFDHDDNGYLKKAELEDAAKGWNAAHGEPAAEDAGSEEAASEEGEEKKN